MQELTKYESVEQLKESSKPADSSNRIRERHDQFESFVNSLKASREIKNYSARKSSRKLPKP
jgi:hypothetical protein